MPGTTASEVAKATKPQPNVISICSSKRSSASSVKSSALSSRTSASGSSSRTKYSTSSRTSLSTVASIQELEARKLEIEAQLKSVEAALKQKPGKTNGVYKPDRPFALLPRSVSGSKLSHR
ncbi:hypothetical protein ACHHYP_11049 [Achlya hypogyna]|uniref:Uncharacterized protein n=1 Tax=Achlya hypogyna TaxID=1202772 RepID=A0A1V9YK24_ACHHY|nr:hypothetical protein ACHHYP_11049 [Achlya hypogyna]